MNKERIREIVNKLGMYSKAAIEATIAGFEKLDYSSINDAAFDRWFNPEYFKNCRAPGTYFLAAVRKELANGTFNAPVLDSFSPEQEAASAPQSVSEFETSWEDWKRLLMDLNDDVDSDSTPSRGVLSHDENTNEVRAVSDGKGGLIYIDGTVSERYPRLEDLEPAEQQELIERVRVLHGSMANLDNILRSMQEHASTS